MVKFKCTMCQNVLEVSEKESDEAQEMIAWCDNCSGDWAGLSDEEQEMRRVKFTRI